MLKRKLEENLKLIDAVSLEKTIKGNSNEDDERIPQLPMLSKHFTTPLWKQFYDLECELNIALDKLETPATIKYIYNPIVYAEELHCAYLNQYLQGPKRLVFVGMNPGPNGMGQTGIPFGNIKTVKHLMNICGNVELPPKLHPKRPVAGLNCTIEEPSGVRIWNLFHRLSGSLENFSKQCFVHNFCPLAFFDANGRNITPSELKGDYKAKIRDSCIYTLHKQLELLKPEIIVAVGEYVSTCLKGYGSATVLKMPHPSPRALNNTNWPEKAEKWLNDHDLIKYINNENCD